MIPQALKKNPGIPVRGRHPENRIQNARLKSGSTQEEVSEILEVTVRTIQHYEAGKTEPKSSKLKLMASLFGCNSDDLIPN